MPQQLVGNMPTPLAQVCRRATEIDGVPMNDGADHEVEAGSTECLTVKGAITDFAALVEEDGALELVRGFALVETGLTAPPQCRGGIHSIMNRVRSMRPSSRNALARSLDFDDAENFLRIADGATVRVVIDAARRRSSSQWSMMRAVLIGTPI